MQANASQRAPESHHDQDDEDAAREWADEEAAKIGSIWAKRYPDGRDWLGRVWQGPSGLARRAG
jgi:hypothetical protein